MAIPPGGEIGDEVHPEPISCSSSSKDVVRRDSTARCRAVGPNDLVFVRSGTRHNFVNTGEGPLRLITVYAPPEHAPGTVHQTKADADAAEG